jgi:TetR/AcrR family transcriptional regulator, transcriptional repressor of aconitase
MPKITEERRTERREHILAAARRCFAEHGYEGATVVRLEEATGLSRGAIFNYFASKEDLFVELAVEDAERLSDLWVDEGLPAVVHEIYELDPDWLAVYLELVRRVRTDSDFRKRLDEREQEFVPANRAKIEAMQRAGELRRDLEPKDIGAFINLVLNGLALARASGDAMPNADLVLRLLEDVVGGRPAPPARKNAARRDRRARRPAGAP